MTSPARCERPFRAGLNVVRYLPETASGGPDEDRANCICTVFRRVSSRFLTMCPIACDQAAGLVASYWRTSPSPSFRAARHGGVMKMECTETRFTRCAMRGFRSMPQREQQLLLSLLGSHLPRAGDPFEEVEIAVVTEIALRVGGFVVLLANRPAGCPGFCGSLVCSIRPITDYLHDR